MKNTKFYFQHDFEAVDDPKILWMLSDYGATGYGLYWRIAEMLHKDEKHILPFKEYLFNGLAKQMVIDENIVRGFIADCIDKYELFKKCEDGFTSERVLTNLKNMAEKKQQISIIRKEAGQKGGIKSGEVRRNKELENNS
jgi:hypothetical protein